MYVCMYVCIMCVYEVSPSLLTHITRIVPIRDRTLVRNARARVLESGGGVGVGGGGGGEREHNMRGSKCVRE